MNYKQITKISCRVIAVTAFFKFLYYVQSIITSLIQSNMSQGAVNADYVKNVALITLPVTLGTLVIGIILWALSGALASSIAASNENNSKEFHIDYGKLFGIAIAIAGIYYAVSTLIDIMPVLYTDISYRKSGQPDPTFKVQYIAYAIKFIISVVVVFIGKMKFDASKEKAVEISGTESIIVGEPKQEEKTVEEAVEAENAPNAAEEETKTE